MRQGSLFDEPPRKPRRRQPIVPPTLDAQEAERNRDIGIARSDAAASDEFRAELDAAVYQAAQKHAELVCDAIYEFMPPGEAKGNLHAVGAAMKRAVKAGWLAPTDRLGRTAQVQCNRGPRVLWRSLIYQGRAS